MLFQLISSDPINHVTQSISRSITWSLGHTKMIVLSCWMVPSDQITPFVFNSFLPIKPFTNQAIELSMAALVLYPMIVWFFPITTLGPIVTSGPIIVLDLIVTLGSINTLGPIDNYFIRPDYRIGPIYHIGLNHLIESNHPSDATILCHWVEPNRTYMDYGVE